jgi:hypothetical protein
MTSRTLSLEDSELTPQVIRLDVPNLGLHEATFHHYLVDWCKQSLRHIFYRYPTEGLLSPGVNPDEVVEWLHQRLDEITSTDIPDLLAPVTTLNLVRGHGLAANKIDEASKPSQPKDSKRITTLLDPHNPDKLGSVSIEGKGDRLPDQEHRCCAITAQGQQCLRPRRSGRFCAPHAKKRLGEAVSVSSGEPFLPEGPLADGPDDTRPPQTSRPQLNKPPTAGLIVDPYESTINPADTSLVSGGLESSFVEEPGIIRQGDHGSEDHTQDSAINPEVDGFLIEYNGQPCLIINQQVHPLTKDQLEALDRDELDMSMIGASIGFYRPEIHGRPDPI